MCVATINGVHKVGSLTHWMLVAGCSLSVLSHMCCCFLQVILILVEILGVTMNSLLWEFKENFFSPKGVLHQQVIEVNHIHMCDRKEQFLHQWIYWRKFCCLGLCIQTLWDCCLLICQIYTIKLYSAITVNELCHDMFKELIIDSLKPFPPVWLMVGLVTSVRGILRILIVTLLQMASIYEVFPGQWLSDWNSQT